MQEKPESPATWPIAQEKYDGQVSLDHTDKIPGSVSDSRSRSTLRAILLALICWQSYRFYEGLASGQWSGSRTDETTDPYAAGLADKGWKLGNEVVDHTWLDSFASDHEDSMRKHHSGHHGHRGHHHRCGKHHHHPHPIGPKEAEALFLKVPNNDSVAA
jgi:hypothetical protein